MDETLSAAVVARGSSGAQFDALYRTTCGDVYAYVASLVGDAATAEDVTAHAFERAYRKRRSFDPRRGSERQWLFAIARNLSLDELRRRRRHATPVADPEQHAPSAQDSGTGDERADAVRAAIARLHARDRDLIALKFYAGLSNAEIAATLGISESAAGTRLHRALTTLREACA